MPLFNYACKKCGKVSEILLRGSETPVCPVCGSKSLTRLVSKFAAVTNSNGGSDLPNVPPCSTCCNSGSCPMSDD